MTEKAKKLGRESVGYTKYKNSKLSTGGYIDYDEYYLTKREHFAAMAMQGLIAQTPKRVLVDIITEEAVKCADALLEELTK